MAHLSDSLVHATRNLFRWRAERLLRRQSFSSYTLDEWTWAQFGFSATAFLHRHRDALFSRFYSDPTLIALHAKINSHLLQARAWKGYDYGLGYFYQSFPRLGFSGRRSSLARLAETSLANRTQGCNVLDIGCNTGFISLQLAPTVKHVTGLDFNPHLITVANECSEYLNVSNTRFVVSSFFDFPEDKQYEFVLSLSNHITFDGPVYPTFEGYLQKCVRLLTPGGHLVFESHTSKFETNKGGIVSLRPKLSEHFQEIFCTTSAKGTNLDRDRLLYVGQLR
jgi:SAM-dependent methyltransferase